MPSGKRFAGSKHSVCVQKPTWKFANETDSTNSVYLACPGLVNGMPGSAAAQTTDVSGFWPGTTHSIPPCFFVRQM